uniref:Protein-S-isoprenylcysteine O-methyltransferase n=1 Tax=Syphacia muris TaxID=451379 RepID=A0A0N5A8M0_9BILA
MYWVAAVCSWVEFFLEYYFFPQFYSAIISVIGLMMIITGEVFRKLAMVHAGNGFTHRIIRYKRPKHELVTNGVYSLVRHPGYTGWFIWCIGTQVLLCNPICIVIYAASAWLFFRDRIYDEERLLLQFFGQQYRAYQQRVHLGMPFVRGYHLE